MIHEDRTPLQRLDAEADREVSRTDLVRLVATAKNDRTNNYSAENDSKPSTPDVLQQGGETSLGTFNA
jgi:hypothetical protein